LRDVGSRASRSVRITGDTAFRSDGLLEQSGFELPVPIVRRENGRFFLISLSLEETSGAPGIVRLRRRSLVV